MKNKPTDIKDNKNFIIHYSSNFYRAMTAVHRAILPKWLKFGGFCHQVLILKFFCPDQLPWIYSRLEKKTHVQRYQNEIAMDQFEYIFEQNIKFVASKNH